MGVPKHELPPAARPDLRVGAYDALAQRIRTEQRASGVVVLVFDGINGTGASLNLQNDQQRAVTIDWLIELAQALALMGKR